MASDEYQLCLTGRFIARRRLDGVDRHNSRLHGNHDGLGMLRLSTSFLVSGGRLSLTTSFSVSGGRLILSTSFLVSGGRLSPTTSFSVSGGRLIRSTSFLVSGGRLSLTEVVVTRRLFAWFSVLICDKNCRSADDLLRSDDAAHQDKTLYDEEKCMLICRP